MATVNTKLAAWIGNELQIAAGDFFMLPSEFELAPEYRLCSAHQRSLTGAYLGRRWYLQEYGHSTRGDLVNLVSVSADCYGDEALQCCLDFLAHHGYKCVDEACGIYRRK